LDYPQWHEATPASSTPGRPNPAYRFLITDRDLSGVSLLRPYDPATARGPLRLRNGIWYWNGEYTSEFMLDIDLPLRRCVEISAIPHRGDRCRLYPSNCAEAVRSTWSNGARTLAYIIARDLTRAWHCFVRPTSSGGREPGSAVRDTLGFLLDELMPEDLMGRSVHSAVAKPS
jgi:hypothetical protein